jgi:hypothetical protein
VAERSEHRRVEPHRGVQVFDSQSDVIKHGVPLKKSSS